MAHSVQGNVDRPLTEEAGVQAGSTQVQCGDGERRMDQKLMSRRRFAELGSSAAFLFIASACGQTSQTTGANGAAGTGSTAKTGDVATGASGRKALPPAKITFFTHWGGTHHLEGQNKAIETFQQDHPDMTVEMVTRAATAEKIITAITGGTPPDLVAQSPARLIPLALKGTWRPLEEFMRTSPVVKRENYHDLQLKIFTWKGKLLAIPAFEHFGGSALSYNMAHFEEAGLNPQTPPRTPEELMKAHEKITKVEGGQITRLGIDPRDAAGGNYTNWANTWGVKWWDPDALKLELNHPLMVEAHTFIASFYRQERAAQIAEFRKQYATWTNAKAGIVLGTQSMQLTGYYHPGELANLPVKPERMGYTWWPNPKAQKVYVAQGWGGTIPVEAKLPDHGWRLLEFFAGVKGGQIMFDTIGWLNGSKQFLKEGKFDKVPNLKFFQEMPAKADVTAGGFATPIQDEIDKEYGAGMAAVIKGEMTPKVMLDDLHARMKQRLEETLR
ncbi:MAG TPA: hypothetical protein VGW38_25955 [Chloroflexota bacterium]|nr:hypothetical protein [Chloroflexota bacterium]